jgi:hypothetical protein
MLRAKYNFTNNRFNGNGLKGFGLDGHLYSLGATTMRVFCPEHKRSFFAPRQSPVKCENRGHVLGEFDFAGERKAFQFQWQYCCNCEHFALIDFHDHGLQRCPVCNRKTSTLYLCDRCCVVSFESNTPLGTKNFTLTAEGAPRPCCPGCLQPASADLREHTCEVADTSFVTGLSTCPICQERLDIGPTFPSTVAKYVRKTRAANKLYVTFDYETELFVPIEDGEFIVIKNNDETGKTFVLPRATRLAAPRDFYELYQDYYHCTAPEAGEINIAEPAVVADTSEGWKFQSSGVFTIVSEQPKKVPLVAAPPHLEPKKGPVIAAPQQFETKRVPLAAAPQHLEPPAPEEPQPSITKADDSAACAKCGTLIEAKYSFCWKCGHPRSTKEQSSGFRPQRSRLIVSATEDDDDDLPGPQDQKRSMLSKYSWASAVTNDSKPGINRSVLKLFGILVVGFLIGSVIAVSRYSSGTAAAEQPATPQVQASAAAPPVQSESPPAVEMKQAAMEIPSASPEDTALEQLRQMRSTASASEQSKILKNFYETERKYSGDYRFPYERAKVVVMTRKRNFREEAFTALARAAQKAIHSGKAREMLQNLSKDSEGDFQRLSHGRREWGQLQKALKNKDVSVLEEVNEGL